MRATAGPIITFGFRGEEIIDSIGDRRIELGFTWCNGPRIYPGQFVTLGGSNEAIAPEEKVKILRAAIAFVNGQGEVPIVVVNVDDPDRALWDDVCETLKSFIKAVEYTSNQEHAAFMRKMYLGVLKAGKRLTMCDHEIEHEIKDEAGLDAYLRARNERSGK